jgi:hypothetical protein
MAHPRRIDAIVSLSIRRSTRLVWLLAAIGIAVLSAHPARAQLWLAPADSAGPSPNPAKAAGAVIWSHGRSVDAEDSQAPTPPYMAALAAGGWDVFRFNRMRASDTLAASTAALAREVHKLKQRGYRRVALAGQSFGAFLSLMTADASDEVDTVIATAPAAFGSFSEFYDSWRENATRLYPVLAQVRQARVMVFFFHGDDFDPGGRGERARDILASRHLDYMVVDQPPRLIGHWAAATPLFARLYGGCVLAFLDAARSALESQCSGGTSWAGTSPATPRQTVSTTGASTAAPAR